MSRDFLPPPCQSMMAYLVQKPVEQQEMWVAKWGTNTQKKTGKLQPEERLPKEVWPVQVEAEDRDSLNTQKLTVRLHKDLGRHWGRSGSNSTPEDDESLELVWVRHQSKHPPNQIQASKWERVWTRHLCEPYVVALFLNKPLNSNLVPFHCKDCSEIGLCAQTIHITTLEWLKS